MRYNIFFLLIFLTSTAFAQKQKFEIKGSVGQSLGNKKLYFSRVKMYGGAKPESNLITVVGGKFLLKGEVEEPEQAIISFAEDAKPDSNSLVFILDKGSISIDISDKLSSGKISGSKADRDFKAYLNENRPVTAEFNAFYQSLTQQAMKGANRDSLQLVFQNAYERYQQRTNEIRLQYAKQNPDAFISLILLPEIAEYSQNYALVDSLFNSLSPEIKKSTSSKIIAEKFAREKQLAVGAVAPEFEQQDTSGKSVSLKDFRGKYVLLDFWASWCGPCRQENPNVVNVYNRFKDKNFTVLGVSLDRPGAKSAWLKAIKDDNLTWTQVSDLKFWKNDAALLYNVTSIPQNFLLDPRGKIIAKNLRGEQLEAALEEILSSKN